MWEIAGEILYSVLLGWRRLAERRAIIAWLIVAAVTFLTLAILVAR